MKLKLFVYFLLLPVPVLAFTVPIKVLKINIFSSNNGKGLEISRQILKRALIGLGHEVYEKDLNEKKQEQDVLVDINIFFERINVAWIASASANWFIPNPECYEQDLSLFDAMDLILCRTHEVERIFQAMHKKTFFMGFSSLDGEVSGTEKDFLSYLHVAGGSPLKGTDAVIKAWDTDLSKPQLIIIIHYDRSLIAQQNVNWITQKMPLDALRLLQNSCGIHLCLSETEGFGHYLMEAMSTSAVVVTTDAPPMNEFITDKRCLVPYFKTSPCKLATRYFVDSEKLSACIEHLMTLSPLELQEIGEHNRQMYLKKTHEFHENLKRLMSETVDLSRALVL